MPALRMKATTSIVSPREGSGLGVCQKSSKISKNSCSQVRASLQEENVQSSTESNQDFTSSSELSFWENKCDDAVDYDIFDGEIRHCQSPLLSGFESSDILEFLPDTYLSEFETIFSPLPETVEYQGDFHNYTVNNGIADVAHSKDNDDDDDDDNGRCSSDQNCNVSDFHISDMIVAGIPFDGPGGFTNIIEVNSIPNHECLNHDMIFDMSGRYMILPSLEETVEISDTRDDESCELTMVNSDDACLYFAIQQMNTCGQEPELDCYSFYPNEVDGSDAYMFIRNVADISNDISASCPMTVPSATRKRKDVSLVLDLDETLVHSTLDRCIDADFTFPVFFNKKEHTVFVRRRPYLQTFLERVAEMFEIIIFTASQSTYAEKLLNILDPEGKLISRRAYRESCIFSDGTYTKDLTILGVDLAKVAIIDNSPQVFRLQVNNGIPIKSWFDDPSDCALIQILPFLETLVDADDVRPIIAKRFSDKQ